MDNKKKQAREFYETNYISFANLAKESQTLLGFEVTLDQLKEWSSKDGGWIKAPLNDSERAKILSDILFEAVTEEEDSLSAKDLTSLINSWVQLQTKINPESRGTTRKPMLQEIRDILAAEKDE